MTIRRMIASGLLVLVLGTILVGCSAMNRGLLGRAPTLSSLESEFAIDEGGAVEASLSSSSEDDVALATYEPAPVPVIRELGKREDLQSLIDAAPGVVLVDFHATWCGPCKKQSVVLEELAEYAANAKAQIIKVDHDQRMDLVRKYKVRSLPTLVAFKDGKVLTQKTGLTSRRQLESMLR